MSPDTLVKNFIESLPNSELKWVLQAIKNTHSVADSATILEIAHMMNIDTTSKAHMTQFEKIFKDDVLNKWYEFEYKSNNFEIKFSSVLSGKLFVIDLRKVDEK